MTAAVSQCHNAIFSRFSLYISVVYRYLPLGKAFFPKILGSSSTDANASAEWSKVSRDAAYRVVHTKCQLACKPGSVRRIAPPRWPFIWDARRRAPQATNPDGDAKTHSAPQPKPRSCAAPIRFCSRRGLPCQPCCQSRGALLPHPFTLTRANAGGLLSVALSLGSPPPDVIRRRVSVEPGLSSTRKALRPCGPQRASGSGHPANWHCE